MAYVSSIKIGNDVRDIKDSEAREDILTKQKKIYYQEPENPVDGDLWIDKNDPYVPGREADAGDIDFEYGKDYRNFSIGEAINTLFEMIENMEEAILHKASVFNYTGTLPSASWTGEEAPYTKAVTVNGILETDNPIVDMVCTGIYETDEVMQEDWAKIYRVVTSANTLTFYAKEVPAADINFIARCVR